MRWAAERHTDEDTLIRRAIRGKCICFLSACRTHQGGTAELGNLAQRTRFREILPWGIDGCQGRKGGVGSRRRRPEPGARPAQGRHLALDGPRGWAGEVGRGRPPQRTPSGLPGLLVRQHADVFDDRHRRSIRSVASLRGLDAARSGGKQGCRVARDSAEGGRV